MPGGRATRPGRASVLSARRTAVLVGLGVACTLTLAPQVRLYVDQERRQAALEQEIDERRTSVADLEGQLGLWGDDAFVAAQARERLNYVMPGETGYVVALPEEPADAAGPADEEPADGPWYRRVWTDFQAAG
ncbi:MAG: septum formation initiator family protein [Kineosporiaceae bacterium]